jgi:hypothetical protein
VKSRSVCASAESNACPATRNAQAQQLRANEWSADLPDKVVGVTDRDAALARDSYGLKVSTLED